jgi:hypothetical protein
MIAFGTVVGTVVVVAVAAVVLALRSARPERRMAARRQRGRDLTTAKPARAATLLAEERAPAGAQLAAGRQPARDQEQLTEAQAVQVVVWDMAAAQPDPVAGEPEEQVRCLVGFVVNRGKFTITGVEARFRCAGSQAGPGTGQRVPGWLSADPLGPPDDELPAARLAPWDAGLRFVSDPVGEQHLAGAYVIARWTDWRGTRWEHRHGQVRQVTGDTQRTP